MSGLGRFFGKDYKYKLFFVPNPKGTESIGMVQRELLQKTNELIGEDKSEEILHMEMYKNTLTEVQLTSSAASHHFLVFSTKKWYYSIEKNDQGLFLQRAEKRDSVIKYIKGDRRRIGPTKCTQITLMKTMPDDNSNGSLKRLIKFVWDKKLILNKYHIARANCQMFAKIIFDHRKKSCKCILRPPS